MKRQLQHPVNKTLQITVGVVLTIIAGLITTIGYSLRTIGARALAADSTVVQTAIKVNISNDSFQPNTVTVPVGTTVTWTNQDMVIHSITSGTSQKPTGLFDSDIAPYGQYSYTFQKPGTYSYYCKYHPMTGTIVVKDHATGSSQGSDSSNTAGEAPGSGDMGGMDMGGATNPSPSGNAQSLGTYGSSKDHIAPLGTGTQGEPLLPDGLRLLPYKMDHGYKVFHLNAKPVWWQPTPGHRVEVWAYNGTVPGPEIRVNTGDKIKVVVTNGLPEGSTVHWHGLDVPFSQDGSGGVSQPDIAPGKSWTYTFQVQTPPGTYIYHAHPINDMLKQDKMGLWGPFIVEPKGTGWKQTHAGYQREYTLVLNDSPQLGYTINGKSFPATQVLQAHVNDKVLIHLINIGSMDHPMHLHGMHFQQIEQDGYPLPAPVWMDTIDVVPGTTYDIQLKANNIGKWLFHCHIVDHVVDSTGQMTGLVTFLNVTK